MKRKLSGGSGSKDFGEKEEIIYPGEHNKDSDDKPNIWQMKKKERKTFVENKTKKCSKAEKSELVEKILNLIAGHSHEVIFKHDTGRVIQACVKFGTEQQRQKLFEQFKDDFGELIKVKIFKVLYEKVIKIWQLCNSAPKAYLIQEFYGADFAFFKSSELCSLEKVLESEPARKAGILKYMKDALLPLVDKSVIGHSIVHRVLLEYLTHADENSRLEMIELIKDTVVLILHTHDGARVGMYCLWHGTTKDRKILIKSFKSYYVKICKEIHDSLQELAMDTYGRKVLMYLLCPRSPAPISSHCSGVTQERRWKL
ncbi:hypothetical protein OS493_039125 [Desmophyllum pertusum]|uniref:PUM-HD domain-containing protein n=1 Tax=Desmophyllum pertusum TaxID=174260 RepID=A0A9X0CQ49_9CNID|nr:hypothetical protein OS493_039125 [Desmophyllum pertusum]